MLQAIFVPTASDTAPYPVNNTKATSFEATPVCPVTRCSTHCNVVEMVHKVCRISISWRY